MDFEGEEDHHRAHGFSSLPGSGAGHFDPLTTRMEITKNHLMSHPLSAPPDRPTFRLFPGQIHCSREPHLVGTILGSCVAVCLWDRRLRFGGMNHFVLPLRPPAEEPSVRFGDVAISALVDGMVGLGSNLEDIQAKLFGGANVLVAAADGVSIGRRNVKVAVRELYRRRIPIVAGRLAGDRGIVLLQCTACGDVWVRPIEATGAFSGSLGGALGGGASGGSRLLRRTGHGGASVGRVGGTGGDNSGETCPTCGTATRSGEQS